MNRRDMLKGLSLAPLFGVPSFLDTENVKIKDDELNYKDFNIHWSGFRSGPDSDKITGFWTANHKTDNKINFYSCTGGISDSYLIGHVFNTCVYADHKFLVTGSPEEDKEEEKQKALKKLKEEIDNYYEPKFDEEPEYKFGFTGFKP